MASKRRIAQAIRVHNSDKIKRSVVKKCTAKTSARNFSNIKTTSTGSSGGNTNNNTNNNEASANIRLAAAVWKRMQEEEKNRKIW